MRCILAVGLLAVCVCAGPPWNGNGNGQSRSNWDSNSNGNGWSNSNSNNGWNSNSNSNGGWNSNNNRNNGWNENSNNWGQVNNNNGDWDRNRQKYRNHNNRGRNNFLDRIFGQNGNGDDIAKCGTGQEDWLQHTWSAGSIRQYYIPKGPKPSLAACIRECDRMPECYFATMTGRGNCYLLDAKRSIACNYFRSNHYGPSVEYCTPQQPCPSAYRVCRQPKCALSNIMAIYCRSNGDQDNAVQTCRPDVY